MGCYRMISYTDLLNYFFRLDFKKREDEVSYSQLAIERAEELWAKDILDVQRINGRLYPGDIDEIMEIIKEGGTEFWFDWVNKTGGYSERPRIGKDGKTYQGVEWCGYFASACFVNLHPKLKKYVMGSTRRLHSKAKWRQAGFKKPASIPPEDIQPGDVVVIYNKRRNEEDEGDHITLAISTVDKDVFRTIEGNAYGQNPSGQCVEGVIKKQRLVGSVAHVYRFTKNHMTKAGK